MPGAEGRRPAGEDALNVQHTGAGSSLRSVLSYVSYSQTCGNAESEKVKVYICICLYTYPVGEATMAMLPILVEGHDHDDDDAATTI